MKDKNREKRKARRSRRARVRRKISGTTETPRRARAVGRAIAEAAAVKGIKKVAFDRGGYLYHGRVAALADEARKAGLEF